MAPTDSMLGTVRADLLQAIANDRLILPTLPEVALNIREAAARPDLAPRELSELLSKDAAISARLIRVANSPLARSFQRIESLPAAVSRLGVSYSCNLAVGLAMEQMFQATTESIDVRMREAWQHSTEVAAVAGVLARHYTRLAPDQAALAGLVHEIGILPVLTYAEENDLLTAPEDAALLDQLIADCHPQIGEKILDTWHFSDQLKKVPVEHRQFGRQVDNADYVDIVMVAKLQCLAESAHPLAATDWGQVPAFRRLGLSTERDTLTVEDLDEEMEAALAALS